MHDNADGTRDGYGIYVEDSQGVPIAIGDWIKAGAAGEPHCVVGIAVNRFHGSMVMVDDPITGMWACVTPDTIHCDTAIDSWEELVDAAGSGRLPKAVLVNQAKALACRRSEVGNVVTESVGEEEVGVESDGTAADAGGWDSPFDRAATGVALHMEAGTSECIEDAIRCAYLLGQEDGTPLPAIGVPRRMRPTLETLLARIAQERDRELSHALAVAETERMYD